MNEIAKFPVLDRDEELATIRRAKAGDARAREKMIVSNLRFVVTIAKSFQGYALPLEDLIAEGNLGLSKAIERFDPEFGTRFATYAGPCIKQSIREALGNQGRTIRVPLATQTQVRKVTKLVEELTAELGRTPVAEDIEEHSEFSRKQLTRLRGASLGLLSLDERVGENGRGEGGDAASENR